MSRVIPQGIPSGVIFPFGGYGSPKGYLLCDGSVVSRLTYASLFAAIGTVHGQGDGLTTFHLPDYRGRFLRGSDNMGTGEGVRDPNRHERVAPNVGGNAGNQVGSVQSDCLQNITANIGGHSNSGGGFSGAIALGGSYSGNGQNSQTNWACNFDASRVVRTSSETRPQNAHVNYIIKI